VFIDSRNFFSIYSDMLVAHMEKIIIRNSINNPNYSDFEFMIFDTFLKGYNNFFKGIDPNGLAMIANVKFKRGMASYAEKFDFASSRINKLMSDRQFRHKFENQYLFTTPISTFLQSVKPLEGLLKAFLVILLSNMVMLAF
jgi:hypothetical protein